MKKINDIKDINLDDFKSILLDLENYPKDFCSKDVNLIREAIRQVTDDILYLEKGKEADEILVTDRAIKLTRGIFKLFDLLKDDLNNAEKRHYLDKYNSGDYNYKDYNDEYYKDLEALYKDDGGAR